MLTFKQANSISCVCMPHVSFIRWWQRILASTRSHTCARCHPRATICSKSHYHRCMPVCEQDQWTLHMSTSATCSPTRLSQSLALVRSTSHRSPLSAALNHLHPNARRSPTPGHTSAARVKGSLAAQPPLTRCPVRAAHWARQSLSLPSL